MSGCRVGPDYSPTVVPAPNEWHQQLDGAMHSNQDDVGAWWTLFNDPVLDALIECSIDGNLTSYAALTRVWQARTQVCVAEAAKKGSVSGTGSYTRSLQSMNAIGGGGGGGIPGPAGFLLGVQKITQLGLMTSWEPDIWGRVFRQIEAAEANECERVEAYRDSLVMLYGDIARSYVEIRTLQARLEYAKRNVQIQQRAWELVQRRVEGGISPVLEEHQAESNLASTESEIPQLESQLHQALNRLAVLAGEYPGTLHDCLAQPFPIPEPPENLPMVLPCNVIRQRPDIRQAERTLAARTAQVGVAVAELYPRLQLGGTFGFSSNDVTTLFDSDSWGYSFGPSFTWPIFNAGRIKCEIQNSKFALEEAIATYQQAVLTGIEEVENAIVAYNNERVRRAALGRTVEAAEKSLESVLELYRNDKTDFQNVLDTLRTLFTAQNSLAASEGQTIQNLITLYRALGGGWAEDAHCVDRCVRLRCPQRADASIVDLEPTENAAERYFDSRSDQSREAAQEPKQLDLPGTGTDDPDVKQDETFDVDAFFKKVLDRSGEPNSKPEVGDRLKEQTATPADAQPAQTPVQKPLNDSDQNSKLDNPFSDATAPPVTDEAGDELTGLRQMLDALNESKKTESQPLQLKLSD